MTFPPCSPFRNTWLKLGILAMTGALAACSSVTEPSAVAPVSPKNQEKMRQKVVSSRYEWAVQNYEAGEYDRAIQQFLRLEKLGPDLESYELVSFYLGMSHFQKKEYAAAVPYLENFLKVSGERNEGQDARIALLTSYEGLRQWDRLLGLAAETDKLTLFQNNRAYLKLLWGRALQEKGEFRGARLVLKEAGQYLDGQEKTSAKNDPDQDLWGRFHYANLLLAEAECRATSPKEVGKKRLYDPWLDATVDCYRRLLGELTENLARTESPWLEPGIRHLDESITALGQRLTGFLAEEKKTLAKHRALADLSRRHLYRLLSRVDESLKIFENQNINSNSLRQLRKRLDLLLVSISSPS